MTTEDGVRILLAAEKRYNGYIIEQEMCLLANQTIAAYLAARGLPALYRNHPVKTTFASTKATYGPGGDGHDGLQVSVYVHATHPLHRYPDLINQRIFLAAFRGEPSPYTVQDLEALASLLNVTEARIKKDKLTHFRREYDDHLSPQCEEGFTLLDQKQFHSVIRKAAEEQRFSLDIVQEILHRLEQGELKANDLYTLVFRFQNAGEEWECITRAVCRFLQDNPAQAMMVFHCGQQRGQWTIVKYDKMSMVSPFQVQVSIHTEGGDYRSSVYTASKREHARQQAIADVLTQIVLSLGVSA